MQRLISQFIFPGVCLVYTVGLYVWYTLGWVVGDRPWWLALLNTFSLYLFIPLPLLIILALPSRRKMAWLAVGAATALWLVLYGYLFIPPAWRDPTRLVSQVAGTGRELTVLTHNTPFPHVGGDITNLVRGLREPDADILMLQELDSATLKLLQQRLRRAYPYSVDASTGGFTFAIFSRYPLRREAVVNDVTPDRPTLIASVNMEDHEIVLVNLHPTATAGSTNPRDFPRLIQTTFPERKRQIEAVVNYLASETRPVILAGDLNTTDQTAAYRQLARRYTDSWRAVGYGLGHTFPTQSFGWRFLLPARAIRIDYLFYSSPLRALEAWTVNTGTSDHWGVVVRLGLS